MCLPRPLVALVIISVVAASCGSGAGETDPPDTAAPATTRTTSTAGTVEPPATTDAAEALPPADYAGFRAQPTACDAEVPPPFEEMTFDAPEDMNLGDEPITAVIRTSCGDLVVELDPSIAPETVNSFVFLADQGFFDGTVSHRIMDGFVMQAGDPTATGFGDAGYSIPDEFPEAPFVYEKGMLAMANAGPGTTGSQFFISFEDLNLAPRFNFFGQVVEGEEVLGRIAAIPLGPRGSEISVPLETLYIQSVDLPDRGR